MLGIYLLCPYLLIAVLLWFLTNEDVRFSVEKKAQDKGRDDVTPFKVWWSSVYVCLQWPWMLIRIAAGDRGDTE